MLYRFRSLRCRCGLVLCTAFLLLALWISLCIGRVDFAARLILICALATALYTGLAVLENTRWARMLCILYEACLTLGLTLLLACCLLLNVTASRTAVEADAPDADYVVVFGAAVHGETPSLILQYRVRTAFRYLTEHPTSRAILTGGMGARESITEAEVMRRLLVQWGIDDSRLILETAATDTRENALFSVQLMDSPESASVLAISNTFHLRRCVQRLNEAGITEVCTLAAPLPSAGTAVSMYIRETVATVYYFLFSIV